MSKRSAIRQYKEVDGKTLIKVGKRWRPTEMLSCLNCHVAFLANRNHSQRFCSNKCGVNYYNMEGKCIYCGGVTKFKRSQLSIYPNRGRFCSMRCMYAYTKEFGIKSIHETSHGYLMQGRHYQHRKIMMDYIKRPLLEKERVHHIDLDKKNNILENLYLCPDLATHHKLHWQLNRHIKRFLELGVMSFKNGEYLLHEEVIRGEIKEKGVVGVQ